MSDIRMALEGVDDPQKSIGKILIDFYENMKDLERDPHRGGKQATLIIMTMNDILGSLSTKHQVVSGKLTDEEIWHYR